ncbi:DUF488 family protein [Cognatilysobacter bugurensis]|uniref:DUF488 domain-containing protein n=1 Tax=Cognatilysobacter bugurensis TaxID=543356 RepID=A0A918SU55_9GAMM|nr:DUF488 domain-containing protein [Lysobacter bugurensis]GHA70574.1 hypothetical protein GCM10007067_03470 [Lysobacter bugurensis]
MERTGTLWTVGHSTRPLELFFELLQGEGIEVLVDVRRFAGSRRNPQYSSESMARALPAAGFEYVAMPDLGGRRQAREDTPHTAWRNASFRGYADYMDTAAYANARSRLVALALERRTAVMCAEAMWWQCHRSLISDDLKAAGWTVLHILAPRRVDEHPYTSAARIEDGRLTYTAPPDAQGALF